MDTRSYIMMGHRPSKNGRRRTVIATILGFFAIWMATQYGWWFLTSAVGFAIALILRRPWRSLISAWLAGLTGWGVPLAWEALHSPILHTAGVVAGVVGLQSTMGWVIIAITMICAVLFVTMGAWVGLAILGLRRRSRSEW